ncbi:unnamed protein product [Medioppia subpectinata]|uniref:Uncharacterized protein n=1 Tax=Medioppia subpectinata TaxID=1979941 RepID=A0A7R9LY54_9ACAR|nr:unnamed protein product [Medioppia subpectinata]CAG2122750.1 unnamed protein product [Medioppia subpectinata]
MNGQTVPVNRHQYSSAAVTASASSSSRRDTNAIQNMYKVVAIEGYGNDDHKIDLYYRLENRRKGCLRVGICGGFAPIW